MPLSWNEIKSRALAFSKEWQHESSEDAEAKSFWDGFFHIFGISRKRVASFELPVKKLGDKQGFIDLFWKGVLLVEHKSRGKNLDKAYSQALDYFPGLKEYELPRYVLVSDFARFRLYDLVEQQEHEFALEDLYHNIKLFGFIAGYQTHKVQEQDPVNIEAAERMGKLHDQMRDIGYQGHELEVYLVRLLFCLFAEDTGIFERQQFQNYIEERTSEDGSDLAQHLTSLFQVLNTPADKRFKNLDEQLAAFPYINGKLFAEMLPTASFDSPMRQSLLNCCALDWSRISPAIFGSLFQSIMDKTARRNLGAHYTSEGNILKLIKPLFLDELWSEFERIKNTPKKLPEFQQKLRSLTFLDPACGCGNFLVIAYRELRLLELEVLRAAKISSQQVLDVSNLILVNVDQFYGIEIEEFPAQIAQVALWLMDHQMNLAVSQEFGAYFARIPLSASGTIKHGNALQLNWTELIAPEKLSFIMGNPPFIGKNYRSAEQDADIERIFTQTPNMPPVRLYKSLDFVAAWHYQATAYMQHNPAIKTALVSTNSITQGEQVSILWPALLAAGVQIHFAHRTFSWSNEARGKAAVHCIILGFSLQPSSQKTLYIYDDIKGEPYALAAKNINPYLLDAPNILVENRNTPLSVLAPTMTRGSQPTDGGNLLLSSEEKIEFINLEPLSAAWIKPFLMGDDFINGASRFCLWLKDCPPNQLKHMPLVLQRLNKVKEMRLGSKKEATRRWAEKPMCFTEDRQSATPYLAIPRVSSERRLYIPIGFLAADNIAGDKLQTISDASLFHFGILTSTMHNTWMRTVAGRLESRYSYSVGIVYNNFPWPENPSPVQVQKIETAAQAVLDARAQFPGSSLADLYDPLTMPPVLLKAHQTLDKAVDAAYLAAHKGKASFTSEAERVAFLFERYQQWIEAEIVEEKTKKK